MSDSHSPEKRKRSIKPYILLAVITIVFICLMAFTLANTQRVHVSFVVAETDTSLIVVMLVSAGLGLALGILGLAEQGRFTVGLEQQAGIGLGKARQIIKVAVVAVRKIAVAIAGALGCGGNDGNSISAQLRRQSSATLGVNCGREGGHFGIVEARAKKPLAQPNQPSCAKRCGVPTSVQAPSYNEAPTAPTSIAALSIGAKGAGMPVGFPAGIAHHAASKKARLYKAMVLKV